MNNRETLKRALYALKHVQERMIELSRSADPDIWSDLLEEIDVAIRRAEEALEESENADAIQRRKSILLEVLRIIATLLGLQ